MQSTMRNARSLQAAKPCSAQPRLAARPLPRRANVAPKAAAVEAAVKVSEEQILRCVNAIRSATFVPNAGCGRALIGASIGTILSSNIIATS